MTTNASDADRGSRWRRAGQALLKVLGFFVILEPIWMLLPFAGFLYGSVLRIETLARYPATAWLTHFVCPVLSFGWTGPILVVAGFLIFLAGASQIYWAKFRRSGLVTRGPYRFVRHPQYVALTLFGVGILLTWGRAIMFIAFFVMMFLYYYLAKSEERNCLRLFGEAYERYRERTSFILPGDRLLRPMGTRLTRLALPAPVRVVGAFAVTMALCFGLMWLIVMFKEAIRTVPYLTATISFGSPAEAAPQVALRAGEAGGIPFVQSGRVAVARGPWPNAAVPGFAERVLLRLPKSLALASFLTFLSGPDEDVLIVFCAPYDRPDQPGTPGMRAGGGSGGRGPAPDPQGPDRVRLMLLRCGLARGASIADALADKSKRQVHRACIVPVNLARAETEDMIEGKVVTPGPGFPAEERWDFFIRQFQAQRATGVARSPVAQAPGQSDSARLVVVRAPILRTRLDEAFATEILDRLVESASFRDRLRAAGAGGRMVAVAFPRPGEDWYREHHRRPQISIFVMLAHLRDGDALDSLFRPGGRELAGAFTAEMDFKVQRPADSVGAVAMIGPRRDLEERWRFFLSGVGGGVAHHH